MDKRIRLKWQLVVAVAAVQIAAFVIGAAVFLGNARAAVETELASATRSARALVLASMGGLMREVEGPEIIPSLAERLVEPRHVRLRLIDARRGEVPVRPGAGATGTAPVPAWFHDLLAPPTRETRLPVVADGGTHGIVTIAAAPGDEIAEVWQDARAFIFGAVLAMLASIGLLALLMGRALRPLTALERRLRSIEQGDLSAVLPEAAVPELAPLLRRVNALSDSLGRAELARTELNRKLIEVGDAERKAIAMEIHDELGPCLFGLKVKASAIARAAERAGDPCLQRDAKAVLDIVEQVQATNARLLTTLRPMAIGQLSLGDALLELISGFREHHTDIAWSVALPDALPRTDETLDLTIYRFVQEGVTNALRHGAPHRLRVELEVGESRSLAGRELRAAVADDGTGMPARAAGGRGLSAMRDRVSASGGTLVIAEAPEGGTLLTARVPLVEDAAHRPGVAT